METDATRMCALLVGLPDVDVIGVAEWPNWLRVVIEAPGDRPECGCGGVVHRHGVREVELVDLPVFGRRHDWCGASNDGAALAVAVVGATRILRSAVLGAR